MAIRFTKAPVVEVDQIITAAEHIKQRLAFNDRLRSGLGDPTYRLHYMFLGLTRQIRNPDESGLVFPAQGEFAEYYCHLDKKNTAAQWPDAGPGEPEGTNLANPMGAFVFGNPGVESESDRLFAVQLDEVHNADEAWELGKAQRGAYDPVSGALGCPSFTAAQSYYRIVQPYYSPMGKCYGGFMPQPEIVGDCGDETIDFPATNKFQIVFTPLKEGLPVKYYVGFCPNGDSGAPAGTGPLITYISRAPFAYFIYLAAGGVERLERKDYIEGPYKGGGSVQHTDGENLTRMLNRFIADWRGSIDQRKNEDFNIEDISFSFQEFFTSQYFLAPNIGHQIDETTIEPVYQSFTFQSSTGFVAPGTLSRQQPYTQGFVLGGVRLKVSGLASPVTVDILSGDKAIGSITCKLDENGDGSSVKFFADASTPSPLRFRLSSGASFRNASGQVNLEASEQLAYKPEIHDAYLVLRLATSRGLDDEFDLRGPDYSLAKEVFDSYLANGCAISQAGVSGISATASSINVNSWLDSTRRLIRDNSRVIPRDQFIGYEVTNGRSILYFKRYANGDVDNKADSFDNIAGPIDPIPSGKIKEGRGYIVRGPSIRYNNYDYHHDQNFFGLKGVVEFTPKDSQSVYELTAIYDQAPATSFSNEWLMFPQFFVYANADDNIFKPASYADQLALSERCHFYSPSIPSHGLVGFFDYGDKLSLSPEAPTGYRYAKNTNQLVEIDDEGRRNFYRSCRIYEPDAEVFSAQEIIENGESIVKVIFNGRLHHCEEAFTSIPRDISGWDLDALRAEPYRSIENGLREYLVKQALGTESTRGKPGDTAAKSNFYESYDGVWGAVYPRFFFTRLIPLPAEEGDPNKTIEEDFDSVIYHDEHQQMELYLRAMCEGYIDEATSLRYACETGISDFFDYTYENLLFDSSGGKLRWLSFLPLKIRPDGPQGFHALPNTIVYADMFNALSAGVNKLTRARIMLPVRLLCRTSSYGGTRVAHPNIWNPDGECRGGFTRAIGSESPGGEAFINAGDWDTCDGIGASSSAGYSQDCIGSDFSFGSGKNVTEFKFELIDPISLEAVPEDLRDMLNNNQTGFIATKTVTVTVPRAVQVATSVESLGCCYAFQAPCTGFFYDATLGHGWTFTDQITVQTTCGLFQAGVVDPGSAPSGDFYMGRTVDAAFCASASSRSISINPIGDSPSMFVQVPLID